MSAEMKDAYRVKIADSNDIECWMELADIVKDKFPGFDHQTYIKSLIKAIEEKSALIVSEGQAAAGVLAFSYDGSLNYLAVHPDYRRCGIAQSLIKKALEIIPVDRDVCVTTYREGDVKGAAARALYKCLGFTSVELCFEYGYPVQRFVLRRKCIQENILT